MDKEILKEHQKSIKILDKLKINPPRVLIIEGGLEREREYLGKYWCASVNCLYSHGPCLECLCCRDIFDGKFSDLSIFDGRQDSIKIDHVREIQRDKDILPREGRYRVFLFIEAQNLTIQASNSLLKVLEEPKDKNLFVLCVPQKNVLLPTIISRSFVLTLKWKPMIIEEDHLREVIKKLTIFWIKGRGLFDILDKKVGRDYIKSIILFVQYSIFESLHREKKDEVLSFLEEKLTPNNLFPITCVLEKALLMLDSNVYPLDVFYWMALNLYEFFRVPQKKG